jgi:SPP1 gp7 family putative phage head morphogenesis protein
MVDLAVIVERYNRILAEAEDSIVQRINRSLAQNFFELERELRQKYPQLQGQGSLLAVQRKILLMHELKDLLNIANNTTEFSQLFEQLLTLANQEGISLGRELLAAMEGENFVQAVATVPMETVRYAAEEQTRYLARWGEEFASRAAAIVEMGLIQGWGTQKLVKPLMEQLGVTKIRAEMISRTATISASNTAAVAHFKANGVPWLQWVATADDRLCPTCAARNGNVYRLEDTKPPAHGRCRCFVTPIKPKYFELGLVDENWYRQFHEKGIEELKAHKKEPNHGVSPFEKGAGLTKAPKPIWTPKKGFGD